ncbi:MAG TPA: cytochrome P450, partial [Ktedonobacteraceae bacterium]
MGQLRAYTDIPYVAMPDGYQLHLGELLTEAYEQHGPIFRSTYFGQEVLYLVGPEANRFMLVNQRQKFSNYIGWSSVFSIVDMFGRGLLSMDGQEHDRDRKTMNPAFTISYMDRYLPLMARLIREHAASWAAECEIDIYDAARKLTFDIAAQALTGLKAGPEVDLFRTVFMGVLMAPPANSEEEYQHRLDTFHAQMHELLSPKIEERRRNPTDDIFGLLVQARDDEGRHMSDEQIIAHVNILLVAGHETSTSLVAWLMYLLTQHPEYTQRILQEQEALLGNKVDPSLDEIKKMKVLENALSEAERLYPPVANGPRGVIEDFEFQGYHVPAGSRAFYSIVTSHMLPSIWANPTQFDPDRFAPPREEHKKNPYALVGFGGGPRICIGINFAQVEIKAFISHVLRNYQIELIEGQ